MKRKMGLAELAQYTCEGLRGKEIEVTLSGGACVSIYTENAYQSYDLDFIRQIHVAFPKVAEAMIELGFRKEGRHFIHPESDFYVEFPPPPLSVGKERPKEVIDHVLKTSRGTIPVRMLSPTDCVKDRLCQFFYWNDRQSLDQAILVAMARKIDQEELGRWATGEGMKEKHSEFLAALKKKRRSVKKTQA